MEIRERNFWVTGGSRGIGKALCEMLAENGAHLTLINRTFESELMEDLKKRGAASVRTIATDLGKRADIEKLLAETDGEVVDCLINNAGQLTGGQLETQSVDEIYQVVAVNLTAMMHLTRAILPRMLQQENGGKIVNNASVSAFMNFPCASTYSATKAGVVGFTRSLHAELKDTKVTTLTLFTPGVETKMFDDISKKYGKNFDLSFLRGMPPAKYAKIVREAILEDLKELRPQGFEGLGLNLAQHLPATFEKLISFRFKREGASK